MNILTKYELGKMSKAESMAYIDALTTEVDRLQRRSRAHRQNLRSMQAKLQIAHLAERLAAYQQYVEPMMAPIHGLGTKMYRDVASG